MKLFGYWFKESPSGNQHIISADGDPDNAIAVPQDRLVSFRKLPFKVPGQQENPRRCVFEVEGWLESKPEYKQFREAKFGIDYI